MNNQIKGYEYEKCINEFLNTNADVKISYLWKDIPEYILSKSVSDNAIIFP